MQTTRYIGLLLVIILYYSFSSIAQKPAGASVTVIGKIIETTSQKPLEFANVIIQSKRDSAIIQGTISDANGKFTFTNIPTGEYKVVYSFIGFEKTETPYFKIDGQNKSLNLGNLFIADASNQLDAVVVTGKKSTYVSTIDRKTFNVGDDLIGKTGSASDLLQNIPSVAVDIEGNVSLRGSESLTVLINGKTSSLMGANRAAVLQQIPANSIEKIEVITNPSAKYKPDGTSGIINIVLKKNKNLGFNGTATINFGNNRRINGNVIANYNPGKWNIFGSYSLRQDDRKRYTEDYRLRTNNDTISYTAILTNEYSRPLTHVISSGLDYKLNDNNQAGIGVNYNYRDFFKTASANTDIKDYNETTTNNFDRNRSDPEYEKDLELSANYRHSFKKPDHELNVDFTTSRSAEQEDNHYTNIFNKPLSPTSFDNTLIKQTDNQSQLYFEYKNPVSENINFESGYNFEYGKNNMDFYGEYLNPVTESWVKDFVRSNQFIYIQKIHVFYSTWEQEMGKFGFLAGLRAEQTNVIANQVTTDSVFNTNYFRIYPSLHLSYIINKTQQLQLNYSHRINRPDGDEVNPFPEYQDPLNLRIGNPRLKPEDIHSVEMGYQYKKGLTTFLSTVYYRYNYNSKTYISKYINDSVLLTTIENLTKSNSAGLELVLTTTLFKIVDLNLSTNTFYNTIDASSLGYSSNKSVVSWMANLNASIKVTKSSMVQLNSKYVSEMLTPQGKILPNFVTNLGFRQELFKKKAAVILTFSDVFNSLKNVSVVDTPELYRKVIRKRSAQVVFVGFTYNFGKQGKKQKDNQLKFDNQL